CPRARGIVPEGSGGTYGVFRPARAPRAADGPMPRVRKRIRVHHRQGGGPPPLVADLIPFAANGAYDAAVLVSGDDDFVPAVEAVNALGKKVWVATWSAEEL